MSRRARCRAAVLDEARGGRAARDSASACSCRAAWWRPCSPTPWRCRRRPPRCRSGARSPRAPSAAATATNRAVAAPAAPPALRAARSPRRPESQGGPASSSPPARGWRRPRRRGSCGGGAGFPPGRRRREEHGGERENGGGPHPSPRGQRPHPGTRSRCRCCSRLPPCFASLDSDLRLGHARRRRSSPARRAAGVEPPGQRHAGDVEDEEASRAPRSAPPVALIEAPNERGMR